MEDKKVKRTFYLEPDTNNDLNVMAFAHAYTTGIMHGAHSITVNSAISSYHDSGDWNPHGHSNNHGGIHDHSTGHSHGSYDVCDGCPFKPSPHQHGCQNHHNSECP